MWKVFRKSSHDGFPIEWSGFSAAPGKMHDHDYRCDSGNYEEREYWQRHGFSRADVTLVQLTQSTITQITVVNKRPGSPPPLSRKMSSRVFDYCPGLKKRLLVKRLANQLQAEWQTVMRQARGD